MFTGALVATAFYGATVVLALSNASEQALITGLLGVLASTVTAVFGYLNNRAVKRLEAPRRIDIQPDTGPIVGRPDPHLDDGYAESDRARGKTAREKEQRG